MSGYDYNNSIVSRSETEALKEMIFKRARERAEALNADTQEQYTTSVQRDVMDIARDSFVSTTKNNPFAQIVEKAEAKAKAEPVKEEEKKEEIGFPQRITSDVKSQIEYKNKTIKENIVKTEVTSNMIEARNEFANKKTIMGALNFLNSQASIALVNGNSKSFDAIA